MRPAIQVLLAGMLFATGGALIKSCEFPSLQRAGLRAVIAAITIFALLPAARRWPTRGTMLLVLPFFGATCSFVVANTLTTSANAIFLQATAPLWVAMLGPLLLREPQNRSDLITLVGISAGMALFFLAPAAEGRTSPSPRLGDMFAILSGISFALLLLGMRWLAKTRPDEGSAAIAWGNAFTAPIAFALMPLVGQTPIAGGVTDWAVMVCLGTFQVGLAYVLLVRAVPHVSAVRASLLLMIEPALNPMITFAVHGEQPHALTVAGGVVIVSSVVLGAARKRRP